MRIFKKKFVEKLATIRQSIVPSTIDPVDTPSAIRFLNSFDPITMAGLTDIVAKLKPTVSSLDTVPTWFFKQIFYNVGHWI